MTTGSVVELWRYPVKSMQGERIDAGDVTESGFAGDRAFALLDAETGKVASAKLPRLWGSLLQCRARTDGERVAITLGDGTETGTDDPDVHARLSSYLGRPVELTTKPPSSSRYLAAWPEIDGVMPDADRQSYGIGDDVDGTLTDFALAMAAPQSTFFDVAALHVVARATLEHLDRVQPASRFPVERYRPNVVVDGFDPFAENDWGGGAGIAIGDVVASGIIPTMRCIMTTLAQGDLPRDNEVLRTITRENRIEVPGMGTWSCVGAYAAVSSGGRIAIGDAVTIG